MKPKKPTSRVVRDAISAAEQAYNFCWSILDGIHRQDGSVNIPEFQPRLAAAVLKLADLDGQLAQERRRLISRKRMLSAAWFSRRMKLIAAQQQSIRSIAAAGRGIGDAFAWIFYGRDRPLLVEHLKHELVRSLPAGIGGLGELEFVMGIGRIEHCFVLYHGITTILRIGDLSLVDLRSNRIIGFGELKTRQTAPGKLSILCHFTGSKRRWRTPFASIPRTEVPAEPLPAHRQAQLRDQVAAMTSAVDSMDRRVPSMSLRFRGGMYYRELERALSIVRPGKVSYVQAGKGLLLCAVPIRGRTLLSRLKGPTKEESIALMRDAPKQAAKLLPESSPLNDLIIDGIYFGESQFPEFPPGTIPLAWWPLPGALLKKIVFRRVLLTTLFNPAHLLKLLQSHGFSVEPKGQREFEIKFTNGKKTLLLRNLPAFGRLITQALHSEERVGRTIRDQVRKILERDIPPNTHIDVLYFQT